MLKFKYNTFFPADNCSAAVSANVVRSRWFQGEYTANICFSALQILFVSMLPATFPIPACISRSIRSAGWYLKRTRIFSCSVEISPLLKQMVFWPCLLLLCFEKGLLIQQQIKVFCHFSGKDFHQKIQSPQSCLFLSLQYNFTSCLVYSTSWSQIAIFCFFISPPPDNRDILPESAQKNESYVHPSHSFWIVIWTVPLLLLQERQLPRRPTTFLMSKILLLRKKVWYRQHLKRLCEISDKIRISVLIFEWTIREWTKFPFHMIWTEILSASPAKISLFLIFSVRTSEHTARIKIPSNIIYFTFLSHPSFV